MSITLAAAKVFTESLGGTTTETDAHGAVTSINIDYVNNTITFQIEYGTVSGSTFTQGTEGPDLVTVNLLSGAWTTSGRNMQSGTLSGAALTAVQGYVSTGSSAFRNAAEGFLLGLGAGNLAGGTQVNW